MSNSSLISYVKISPNKSSPRNHIIDTITIHCVVGQATVESLGEVFATPKREASSNYGVGYDGKIGMYVEEKDRAWTSSSAANDNRAVTIEVASDTFHPYAVTSAAYESLIRLVADICKRNHIKELKWQANPALIGQVDKQNMTVHRWFAATACPGDYLYNRHYDIANRVNKLLGAAAAPQISQPAPAQPTPINLKIGDVIKLKENAIYTTGRPIPDWVINAPILYVRGVRPSGEIIFSTLKTGDITGAVNQSQLKAILIDDKPFLIRVTADALNIRSGPGIEYPVRGVIRNKGIFTIVKVLDGWGKLKSGIGWINLSYTEKY